MLKNEGIVARAPLPHILPTLIAIEGFSERVIVVNQDGLSCFGSRMGAIRKSDAFLGVF
jgi:hypothetical protein